MDKKTVLQPKEYAERRREQAAVVYKTWNAAHGRETRPDDHFATGWLAVADLMLELKGIVEARPTPGEVAAGKFWSVGTGFTMTALAALIDAQRAEAAQDERVQCAFDGALAATLSCPGSGSAKAVSDAILARGKAAQ